MKKVYSLILFFLALIPNQVYSQVFFSEDFNGIPGSTSGGAGTYKFPAGWLLRNVDNLTPASQVAFVNEAWERREDFRDNVADSAAFSNSFYSPGGAADDWMWTPTISIPAGFPNARLSWWAKTYDPDYRDGYEVRIMVAPNEPSGGTGDLGNQVSASTLLFSISAEGNHSWTKREVDLAAYMGKSVRIAFRNNSNDKFLLLIDDVVVESVIYYDLAITEPYQTTFTRTPVGQKIPLYFQSKILNNGVENVTGAFIEAKVYNQYDQLIFTSNSSAINLSRRSTSQLLKVKNPFIPTLPGEYTVRIKTVLPNFTDEKPGNDEFVQTFQITQTEFARDDNNSISNLGIDSGTIGYLGTSYPINTSSELSDVSVYLTQTVEPGNSMKIGAAVFRIQNGKPTTQLAVTPQKTLSSSDVDGAKWHHFLLSPSLNLSAGDTILAAAVEVDKVLSIGQTATIYRDKSVFAKWPGSPGADWTPIESFGSQFKHPLMVRANFECSTSPDNTGLAVTNTSITSYQRSNGTRNYMSDNCMSLLASIEGTNNAESIVGLTKINVWIEPTQPSNYVRRHYQILPEQNASTAKGIVTLYFTQEDFDEFNRLNPTASLPINPNDAAGISRLLIEKRPGGSSDGSGIPPSYSGTFENINPADNNIVWNEDLLRWEIKFSVTGFSGFFVKTSQASLPVNLVRFTAQNEENQALLKWETSNEVNADFFEVQRSSDGKKFKTIGNKLAKNEGNKNQDYTFLDTEFSEQVVTSYYRLRMVDRDNTFAYSSITSLAPLESGIRVYPNPAKRGSLVQLEGQTKAESIELIDVNGRAVSIQKHATVEGYELKLPEQPGIYNLIIKTKDAILNKKIAVE